MIQRRKEAACHTMEDDQNKPVDKCGFGLEMVFQEATPTSEKLFNVFKTCEEEDCLRFLDDDPNLDCEVCEEDDPTPACYMKCGKAIPELPGRIDSYRLKPIKDMNEMKQFCYELVDK